MRAMSVWLLCLLILLSFTGEARAQTPALDEGMPGTKFRNLSFHEARADAFKHKRLLMVYVYEKGRPNTKVLKERTWRNPTLAAYTLWHATVLRFELHEAGEVLDSVRISPPVRKRDGGMRTEFPKVYIFRDRTAPTEKNWPTCELELATLKTEFADMQFGAMGDAGGDVIPNFVPTPIYVLLQTDLLIEGLKSIEPVWSKVHEMMNPEPAPPEPSDPMYQVTDDSADAILESDLVVGDANAKEGVVVDVLAQLDDAREAALNGEWSRAAGLYTWLWERGEYFDPAFRAARRSVIAGEMRELFDSHVRTRGRFERMRDELTKRLRWADRHELTDWFLLNGVVCEDAETIAFLDLSISDIDEGSMLPRAQLQAYRLMMTRSTWADPWEPAGDPPRSGKALKPGTGPGKSLERMQKLQREMNSPRHTLVQIEDWKSLVEFRREFFFEEACRLHAACLRAGFEQEAWDIGEMLLKVRDDGEAKLALATTAMAAGQEREKHLTWINDAIAAGHSSATTSRDRLVKKLAEAKAAAPMKK